MAKFFLGKPYVGRTLEIGDKESLVVNLRELDCMTLVETCLALSRALNSNEPNFDEFTKELTKIRYRNGIINGYTSRLHYSTDWMYDNEKMEIFQDITDKIGGKPFHPNVGFMSQNPYKYKHLKDDPKAVQQMADYEKAINSRTTYYYIPKNEIYKHKSKIKSGDIIGFTTSMKGLDISHLAIAYWDDDVLTFIHASSNEMKVIINPISIADYCKSIKTNTGIVVLRP
ncbi:MAG: DUF1460 domain-containing protein [Tannerella sp.]|nr:DUF1460 domain-containing protein [Tannerella sp.]